jgi:uncharacterized protein YfaS (alpha-2-macroglobulin family)
VPGTGRVGLSVAVSTSLDIATLLNELDRYPFGCSEQITSRAVAMLYVNELAAQARLSLDGDIDQRIKDAIARLLARQGSNGSFGLWSVGGDDAWLDSYVTDFLTRARERGFEVPATAFTLALDRLRNYVATAPEPGKNGGRELAYALYVLARNGVAPSLPMWQRPLARPRSPRRSACLATSRARIGSIWPRLSQSRRSPSSISAVPISARFCATLRHW